MPARLLPILPVRGLARRVGSQLVAASSLVGRPVIGTDGKSVGRLVDLTVRIGETYPSISGLIVRVGYRRVFVHASDVARLARDEVCLASDRFVLQDFVRRRGEVLLMGDLVDRQLIDTDGVRVIRCSDLYLAQLAPGDQSPWVLVGADVGLVALWRRLTGAERRAVKPDRVIDWADVQAFEPGQAMRLGATRSELHRLRPAELADLLENLSNPQRHQLLGSLDDETAADAVEEMEAEQVRDLLLSLPEQRASDLLAAMEPDEATDALQDLPERQGRQLLDLMSDDHRDELRALMAQDEDTAGGLMNPRLVTAAADSAVAEVIPLVRDFLAQNGPGLGFVVVLDHEGRLLDDVSMMELLVAAPDARLADLTGEPWPVTVGTTAPLDRVVEALRDNRNSSLIVLDEEQRPVGRIEADDVIDALIAADDVHGLLWKGRP